MTLSLRTAIAAFCVPAALFALSAVLGATPTDPVPADTDADAAEQYRRAAAFDDPIARLQKRMDAGEVALKYDPKQGYLPAVLDALQVPRASQALVFSKTSLQRDLIDPETPRAIYFNDACYIGWIPGAPVLELSANDPVQGAVFYTLRQKPTEKPRFLRVSMGCLQCHSGAATGNVPGHMVRSVYVHADGQPELSAGDYVTDDTSPMAKRWGGWYVTGTHGSQRHMGNVTLRGDEAEPVLDRAAGANVTTLSGRMDASLYLTPHSDIVALLVLEHQTRLHNLMTRASYETRDALRDARRMNVAEGKPGDAPRPSTDSRIRSACEPLVKALLFSEAESFSDPIKGTSGFAERFAAASGPKDSKGRSLRELDLQTRLLRYPCSYLIYSEAFDALPAPARAYIYKRLHAVLDGADTSLAFAHLTPDDRKAIREILTDTRPEY
jgi:hypothetical protein